MILGTGHARNAPRSHARSCASPAVALTREASGRSTSANGRLVELARQDSRIVGAAVTASAARNAEDP